MYNTINSCASSFICLFCIDHYFDALDHIHFCLSLPPPLSQWSTDLVGRVVPYLVNDLIDDPMRATILSDQPIPFTLEQLILPLIYSDDESLLLMLLSSVFSLRDLVELIWSTPYIQSTHIWLTMYLCRSALRPVKERHWRLKWGFPCRTLPQLRVDLRRMTFWLMIMIMYL